MEHLSAFIIWAILGVAFIGLGIYVIFSKKEAAFGFWANAKTFEVTDIKAYNKALGILWIIYGVGFVLLGLPILEGANSAGIVLTILGTMFEAIVAMVIYITVIEKKYRK